MTADSANADKVVFTAYRRKQLPRRRRTVLLVLAAALALLLTWLVRSSPEVHKVVTKHGIRTLRHGMSVGDVAGVMGEPVVETRHGDVQCYRYGRPSLEVPSFVLYEACFEGGKLIRVTEHPYSATEVEPPESGGRQPSESP